jgi:hypothetical protein
MDYIFYIMAALLGGIALVASAPLWSGRIFMPFITFALARRFGQVAHKLLSLIKPDLDITLLVKAANRYYQNQYQNTPYGARILFLPFCLKAPGCPAPITKEQGLMCQSQCHNCNLGKLRSEALAAGYGWVYVVPSSRLLTTMDLLPSSQFIKTKISLHKPGAALGVICPWHLRSRMLPSHKKLGRKGYVTSDRQQGAALRGILLKDKNCAGPQVDWEAVRQAMLLKGEGPQEL